jgi:quercetin dioxygenase-like cupin family protein
MKITSVYTGADGESHFREIELPLDLNDGMASFSAPLKVGEVFFRETAGTQDMEWHRAPRRQFVIILGGELEIEVASGEKRRLGPGEVLLAEDTTGRGHLSRATNRKAIIVPILQTDWFKDEKIQAK